MSAYKEKIVHYTLPELYLNENIAVVGSSAKLLLSDYGEFIDTFDDVVRFNRAPTTGFEKDVGSKTTLRVVNNHVFNGNELDPGEWENQPASFVKDLRDSKLTYFAPDIVPFLNKEHNTHKSNEVFLYLYENTKKMVEYYELRKNPSVGIGFILLLILSGFKPNVFGFDTNLNDENRTHYFAKYRPAPSGVHGIEREKQLLFELENEGLITLHE